MGANAENPPSHPLVAYAEYLDWNRAECDDVARRLKEIAAEIDARVTETNGRYRDLLAKALGCIDAIAKHGQTLSCGACHEWCGKCPLRDGASELGVTDARRPPVEDDQGLAEECADLRHMLREARDAYDRLLHTNRMTVDEDARIRNELSGLRVERDRLVELALDMRDALGGVDEPPDFDRPWLGGFDERMRELGILEKGDGR